MGEGLEPTGVQSRNTPAFIIDPAKFGGGGQKIGFDILIPFELHVLSKPELGSEYHVKLCKDNVGQVFHLPNHLWHTRFSRGIEGTLSLP
jgi:hypothetical protein